MRELWNHQQQQQQRQPRQQRGDGAKISQPKNENCFIISSSLFHSGRVDCAQQTVVNSNQRMWMFVSVCVREKEEL